MEYDIIVAGGGPAGIAAAYAGAKYGSKVLLLERYGRLGGMATQAMVGPIMGRAESKIVDEILEKIGGRYIDFQTLDIQLYDLLVSSGVTVLLHSTVLQPVIENSRISGLVVNCREGNRTFAARTVIDATGDGSVAFEAGVPFELGRNSDHLTQPMSIMFTIAGIHPEHLFVSGSEQEARIRIVNGKTWEDVVLEGVKNAELPREVGVVRLYKTRQDGMNIVNATQVNFLNGTCSRDLTEAEITGRKQAFQILEFLRKSLPGYENAWIAAMPSVIGVRETRRFCGLSRLEKEDCIGGRNREDAIVRGANFAIDIHNPSGPGQAAGLDQHQTGTAERVQPYDIPYGALVPQKIEGLLLAGRCLSASHEALASCRVMAIAMAIGAGAGTAAGYAVKHKINLAEVPPQKLSSFLFPDKK